MAERIGLYGGSFDPIHHGHLIVARAVAEGVGLDRVFFLPSANPPHKLGRAIAEADDRAAMVQLAIKGEGLFTYSEVDQREGPSYTIDTVRQFRERLGPAADLYWIIGADSLADLITWRQVGKLVDACRIVTAARPGWDQIDWRTFDPMLSPAQIRRLQEGVIRTPHVDISSTDIRERIRSGRSIRYFVPDGVGEYIAQRGLYR